MSPAQNVRSILGIVNDGLAPADSCGLRRVAETVASILRRLAAIRSALSVSGKQISPYRPVLSTDRDMGEIEDIFRRFRAVDPLFFSPGPEISSGDAGAEIE